MQDPAARAQLDWRGTRDYPRSAFFGQLPDLPQVVPGAADVGWLVYELQENVQSGRYHLARTRTVYTQFTFDGAYRDL
jgi:hypothetical protein